MAWDSFTQDVRFSLRSLVRDKAYFITAILIVGLGIGANTAIFSVVNTLLFRPLQLKDAGRLVLISNAGGDGGLSSITSRVSTFLAWKASTRTMEDMAAWFAFFDYASYSLVGTGEPERLVGVDVSRNFLDFLGVKPEAGRWFTEEEAKWNGTPAVILTYGYWQRKFGGDRHVIGRAITLNDKSRRVVGVLPESFDFATLFTPGSRVDILIPFPLSKETDNWGNTLAVLGRMKPGVTVAQAQSEFNVLDDQIYKARNDQRKFGGKIEPLQAHMTARYRRGLLVLLAAVGAVLLVGCTNLSNLMLSKAASRRKEMAIRSALGAGRMRLIRQMLTESIAVSLAGALFGVGIAALAIGALGTLQGVSIPLLHSVRMDGAALLFTTLATLATGLLFGLAPALEVSGKQDANWLKESGRGSAEGRKTTWTRSALVVSEIALACVLLAGAGLLMRSFLHTLDVNLGFDPERVASWRIDTPRSYRGTSASQAAFYDKLARAVESVPGVESAGVTDAMPLSRDRTWGLLAWGVNYREGEAPLAHPRLVDWRYLRTMRIPLIAGREFNEHDTAESEPVIIINQKAATRLWPGRSAVGQLVNRGPKPTRVVGVVGNVRHQAVEEEGGLEFYLPLTQEGNGSVELVVRTRLPLDAVAPSIRSALRSVDASLPTAEYHELNELVSKAVSPRRFMTMLLAGFAIAAVLLASVGIYGVVAYTVGRRTQEIGIRMALGASAWSVRGHVMRQTLALAAGGVAIGLTAAAAAARLMASMLYRMTPEDPISMLGAAGILLLVAAAAGYLPAVRASRVDPMRALHTE